jgi:hypothetical protein
MVYAIDTLMGYAIDTVKDSSGRTDHLVRFDRLLSFDPFAVAFPMTLRPIPLALHSACGSLVRC